MNSYTPLDIDKLQAHYANTASDSSMPSMNSAGGTSPKASRFPLFAIFIVAATFIATLVTVTKFASNPNVRKSEAAAPTPVRTVIKILAGTDATFSPMEYIDERKEIVGYDIELGKKMSEELNADIEFVNIPWDGLFTALEQKKIDMVIAGVTITDERKQKYIFSDPYLNAGQVVITKKSDTDIKSPLDLKGKKVGVQKGTTNEEEAAKYTSDTMVMRYDDFILAAKDLMEGKVDAVFSDLPAAKGIITDNPGLKIASDPFTEEYYGIVLRKDQVELRNKINTAITSLRQKGILNNLKEKYLN